MYVVRSAVLQDLVVVVSWIRTPSECEDWAGSQVTFPVDLVALPRTIGFTEHNAYVMAEDQSMIAFGQVIDKPHGRQHLAKVIVSPVHRRRGYGRAFVAELLQRTTAERVSLNVQEDNSGAIALYAGAGFADAERPLDQQPSPRSRYMEWRRARTD
jgi:[ribosomal protein S18]-alanine N-acetyltransferase